VSIIDWNVIDISILEPELPKIPTKCSCKKNAKYSIGSLFFCEKHAKASSFLFPSNEFEKSILKKCSVDSLREFEQKWNLPIVEKKELKIDKLERIEKWIEEHVLRKIEAPKKKKESLDFIQIGRNLAVHLSKLDLDDITYVIIENQISPIANKMRTIQGMVAQMFILRNVPTIEFVSSSNKLREYLGESKTVEKKEKEGVNPDYKQHKKEAITYTRQWLESPKSGFSSLTPRHRADAGQSLPQPRANGPRRCRMALRRWW
jgi:hypothetical protein